jgi:hypothetical protein
MRLSKDQEEFLCAVLEINPPTGNRRDSYFVVTLPNGSKIVRQQGTTNMWTAYGYSCDGADEIAPTYLLGYVALHPYVHVTSNPTQDSLVQEVRRKFLALCK